MIEMNIPNKITVARMLLTLAVPFFIISDIINIEYRYYVAMAYFILVFITDALDGIIARRTKSITKFGIIFDPIADKFLVQSALFSLVYVNAISPYIAIILVGRDILISGIRLVAKEQGKDIKELSASLHGKLKTVSEAIMIPVVLLGMQITLPVWIIPAIIAITLFFAIISLVMYIKDNIDEFIKIEK